MTSYLIGAFSVENVKEAETFKYATIQTFRGDSSSIGIDVFFTNNIGDETAAGVFSSYKFVPDWGSNKSVIEQGYDYLETLPMFSNAEKV